MTPDKPVPELSEEELRRREAEPEFTTEEVLAHLEKMASSSEPEA